MPGSEPSAAIKIGDSRFFGHVLAHGEIGLGEAYVEGHWDTGDLATALQVALLNRRHAPRQLAWLSKLSWLRDRLGHKQNSNTLEGSRSNVSHHYDLSNDFYKLWLDETLCYSCAVFESPADTLEEAQRNKYRILCEKAGLRRDDTLLEIGGGWGGFAIYAARTHGCPVTMVNISTEQVQLARERVKESGLAALVDVRLCDYRDIEGQFDKVIVMGMIEQVGAEFYEGFFRVCDSALKPGGRFVLQTITVPDSSFEALRDGVNFFQKYIFPGGMLPSVEALRESSSGTALVVRDVEEIGHHYVRTMHEWRDRFRARLPEIRALGFDDTFIRMWDYYLAASEALFITKECGDVQVIFDKPQQP
jgi:cyclopropane-fatty-acyl-phospholipid synthase